MPPLKTLPPRRQRRDRALLRPAHHRRGVAPEVRQGDRRSADDIRQRVARAFARNRGAGAARGVGGGSSTRNSAASSPPGASVAAGTGLSATLINCFVQPVGDSIAHGRGPPGIYTALTEAAGDHAPWRRRLRLLAHPARAALGRQHAQSSASGPVSYMRVFDRSCETVERRQPARRADGRAALRPPGHRGVHPRQGRGDLKNFNISVGVTDAFMRAVRSDGEVELVHRAEPGPAQKAEGAYQRSDGLWVYRNRAGAGAVGPDHASTYDHAEPGVLFLDRINRDNNLGYCETIGHQPLRRAAAAAVRLLLPGLGRPDALRAQFRSRMARPSTDAAFAEVAASRCACSTTCSTSRRLAAAAAAAGGAHKRRVGLGFTGSATRW